MTTTKELSREDRERLTRLYEEVISRLQEASMIVGRILGKRDGVRVGAVTVTHGLPLTGPPAVHVAKEESGQKKEAMLIKVLCVQGWCFLDEKGNCVGVEDEKAGVCRPC